MHNSSLASRIGGYFLPENQHDLRDRFYEGLCLFAVVSMFAVVLPTNISQKLPLSISLFVAAFGLLALGLWVLARRGRTYPGVFLAAMLVVLAAVWFPNAGSAGGVPFFFFVPLCYVVLFFEGPRMWALACLVIAQAVTLIAVEHAHPELLVPFRSEPDRVLDLVIGILVSGMATAMMLWLAATGYRRERARLRVALETLSETEERFAQIFRVNPDAVYVLDPDIRVFREVNEGFTRITGWSRADALGKSAVDLGLWVDPHERTRLFDELRAKGFVDQFVAKFRRRSGEEFWGAISLALVKDRSSTRVLATTRDVTQQVNAELASAEASARLSTLIDSTDDVIWLVDAADFTLVMFNRAFASVVKRTMGFEPTQGLPLERLLPADACEEWRGFYRRAIEQGPFTIEYAVPDHDQVLLHSFSPVRVGGRVTGIAVFGKDVTERKREEARRDRMELQIVEAQKMESLGSLAGGVAHDFNNMLGGIMGYAELLLEDESDAQKRHDLESIVHAATRSADLTRKLLAFGRRGKNIVEAVDLNGIITDSLAMLRPSFAPTVTTDLALDADWTIDGDPSQMNQLVLNLCINANEAMPGGGRLTLRTASVTVDSPAAGQAGPAEYVELVVEDTGVGMTDDVRTRIFEPFFTTKVHGSSPGTGLGLSTVYGIVHLHHGTIDVFSTPGQGTRFIVRLPRGTAASQPITVAARAGHGEGLVLVVEDEPLLRRFASAALGKLGYEAVTAEDGEAAVDVFRARHGELTGVLLDLKMPKKSGREAFMDFRAIDPAVPVLICSGYGDNEEAQALISLGARGMLAKPYRLAELAERLSRLQGSASH